jgi:hypothetical protein
MPLTNEQYLALGLVGGAAVLGFTAWKRRAERIIPCTKISNRIGGSLDSPCPSELPLDVCTAADFESWLERLSMQLLTVNTLAANLDAVNQLEGLGPSIQQYSSSSAALIGGWHPLWTTLADLNPILNQLRVGCDLLNQGNARLAAAGFREYIVQEGAETEAFIQSSRSSNKWLLPAFAVAAAGSALYLLREQLTR